MTAHPQLTLKETKMRRLMLMPLAFVMSLAAAPNAPGALAQDHAGIRYADIPAGAYAVVADIRAKPGKEKALRDITLALVAQVRAEPENLLYFLHEDREAPGHFVFYEIFANQAAFEAHNATPHVQAWFKRLPELADGDVNVVRLAILGN